MALVTRPSKTAGTFPLDKAVAGILVLVLPIRALSPVAASLVSIGVLAAAFVIWVPILHTRKYEYAGWLLGAFAAVMMSVPLLWFAAGDRSIDWSDATIGMLTVLVAAAHLLVLLWARSLFGIRAVVLLYSAGLIVQATLTPSQSHDNPWKFGLAFPVTALVLALVWSWPRLLTVVALMAVGIVSLNQEYRSFIVFAALTLIVWAWSSRTSTRPRRVWLEIVAFGVVAWGMYLAFVQFALMGWLGERNQAVTAEQIRTAGSALAGGRTESAASFALFAERPIGFGPGVLPNTGDFSVGAGALVSRGVNVDGTYVQDYLFGNGIKLHSVAADLWVTYGLAGLFLAVLFVVIMLGSVARSLRVSGTPALMIFLPIVGLWDMAFSPIGTNLWEVLLIVAVLIPLRRTLTHGDPMDQRQHDDSERYSWQRRGE